MDELKATIGRLIQNARTDSEHNKERSDLFDRYMGEPIGDEQEGRSRFISTDVADVVEALLPDLMDVFTSAEDILKFAPVGPEDEAAARQETDAVSHIFWQKNDGFMILYQWIKEALVQQNSYVKRGWVEKTRTTIEEYDDLSPEEFMGIMSNVDGEYEFLETRGFSIEGGQIIPEMGEQGPAPMGMKIKCVKKDKQYEIACFPQEEFFVTPGWHSLKLEGVPCCGHMRKIERGELRDMGFSEDSISQASQDTETFESENRNDTRDHSSTGTFSDDGDSSTEKVWIYEAYVRADFEGDGTASLLKVWATGDGGRILQWENGEDAIEEVSDIPIHALTPIIIPHRHVGRSVAEMVDDIQAAKTVLMRSTLDNVYATNYGRPYFDESLTGPNTFSDLVNPAHGHPVRTGGAEIQWFTPPSIIDSTLPIMQQLDDLKETRTGATRYNMGLSPESLNQNKTATEVSGVMNASQKKTMLIARTFAETGMRDLFLGIHRDLRNGPMKELVMKLRNEWVAVNPRTWADRTDMTVHVGQGTGDRDSKRAALMQMGGLLEKLMMDPEIRASGQVSYANIRNVADRVMETYGYDNIDEFLPPPIAPKQQEEGQPNPQEQAMQAQMEMAQRSLQLEEQKAEREFALKQQEINNKHLQEMEKIQLGSQKAVMEDDFKRDKLTTDAITGYHRQAPQAVPNEPPIDYRDVLNGR